VPLPPRTIKSDRTGRANTDSWSVGSEFCSQEECRTKELASPIQTVCTALPKLRSPEVGASTGALRVAANSIATARLYRSFDLPSRFCRARSKQGQSARCALRCLVSFGVSRIQGWTRETRVSLVERLHCRIKIHSSISEDHLAMSLFHMRRLGGRRDETGGKCGDAWHHPPGSERPSPPTRPGPPHLWVPASSGVSALTSWERNRAARPLFASTVICSMERAVTKG
jgi:hypothetical protein